MRPAKSGDVESYAHWFGGIGIQFPARKLLYVHVRVDVDEGSSDFVMWVFRCPLSAAFVKTVN